MEIFLKKMVMDKAILCVVFLSGVVTACHLDPDISITSLKLEGLSGSCLQIPCNFTVKEGTNFPGDKQAVAVWIKTQPQFKDHPENVIFNGSRTNENYPVEITGDLSQRDCTTVFNDLKTKYTERYFFRVEAEGFRQTASCDSINITVQDSPWSPTIKVSGEQTEEVTITCSAVTPCPGSPPELTWDLHQGTPSVIEANSDGTFTTKIKLKGTPTASHKRYNLTCSAAYPVKGGKPKIAQTTITLNDTLSDGGPSVVTLIGAYNIVKFYGIILLYSSLVFLECWFRATYGKKHEQRPVQTHRVTETQA